MTPSFIAETPFKRFKRVFIKVPIQVLKQGRRNRGGQGDLAPPLPNIFQQSESALFQQSCKHFLFSLTQS